MIKRNYAVIYEREEDGGYVVRVPALPGCTTEGDTFEEAKAMVEDAIKGYIECLVERNLPVPEEEERSKPIIQDLAVSVA